MPSDGKAEVNAKGMLARDPCVESLALSKRRKPAQKLKPTHD
jgi:hypothetical protein